MIKMKLSNNEVLAVFNSMKLINIDMFTSNLETKAQQELLQKIYMRMMQKMFNLKKENTFTMSVAEGWAFFCKMPTVMPLIGNYEQNTIQKCINIIHQQTI